MKFKLQKRHKILLLAVCYIAAVVLIFLGIYATVKLAEGKKESIKENFDTLDVFSQAYSSFPLEKGKENFRCVWIATVSNINYPSKRSLSKQKLQEELDCIVENCSELGANTIFFQVRACSDAFYKSEIFPWSHYVSGERGKAPDGDFDSLEYLINKAKEKGIAVHAWVNPVRVLSGSKDNPASLAELSPNEPAAKHPEWTVLYEDGKLYFDLAIPELRALVAEGVKEIVENYDVAGVVFDDYFYPYPTYDENGAIAEFDDNASYIKYGGKRSLEDFRRDNVRTLIRQCYFAVKQVKSSVLFGISPFGVWRNGEEVGGSDTSGLESYSSIYCDTLSFVREGTLDYVAPQLYWEIGSEGYDFISLSAWWSEALSGFDIPLIPCLAPYRYSEGSYGEGELTAQLLYARTLSSYGGCAMYGYAALTDSSLSVGKELKALWG